MKENMIRDISLAEQGRAKIDWVRKNMPVLRSIEEEFRREKPFDGLRVVVCVHLEAKTAYLAEVFAAGGAQVSVTGSNPKSTKDDVVAALAAGGLHVYAWFDATREEYFTHLNAALDVSPNVVIDDGGDLVHLLHEERRELLGEVYGACEETTAGVLRNRAREREGKLEFPVLAVNDAYCKYLFDNRYGTGQSTMDAVMRSTNKVVAGAVVVVNGFGWCGRGIAQRAAGLGARVVITEVDPIKALEAVHEGYWVMPMADAAGIGDFFITTTGVKQVITAGHFRTMKDGAVLANAGHFFEEIDTGALEAMAEEKKPVRGEELTGYRLSDGRWINVISDGRIVNISAADGHPAEIMDMSFAVQALAGRYVRDRRGSLDRGVLAVPQEIDERIARYKLAAMNIGIDELSAEQRAYIEGYEK
jgi:adenosylhomocysteinase